ncbi:Cof-type HAD-IIB family hydrolase [Bacillus marinisedimentorum]|uniref:Cof-type HAD-IIB family hydrolase n=1 Tax=Bacillus marinisedimentorum TaxID=1821260 RepID=UPI000871D865|nr:Cof-type HAD-IIB family hydrolase [Bacillus marinisedimentorum]
MKLVAIDMDGTLLNNRGEVSRENADAIRYAQENGVEVAIATGRVFYDVHTISERSGIKTHVIGTNGATAHSKSGELLRSIPMREQDIDRIVSWLAAENFHFEVYTDKSIYTPDNGRERMLAEIDRFKSANPEFDETDFVYMINKHFDQGEFTYFKTAADIMEGSKEYYKVLAFSMDRGRLEKGWAEFHGLEHVSIVSSADNNFELQHKDSSKGNALVKLADSLGIPMENTMAIGDNFNDVSMFEKVRYSVAMGNAKPEIKSLCSMTTAGNDENGVAEALYRFTDDL